MASPPSLPLQMPTATVPRPVVTRSSQRLHISILAGDLTGVERCLSNYPGAVGARITSNSDTPLHVAVKIGTANHIVEFLLTKMSTYQLQLKNDDENTVLAVAAIVGNVEAAEMIMKKLPGLITEESKDNYVPLIEAALHGHKKMVKYLLPFSEGCFLLKDRTTNTPPHQNTTTPIPPAPRHFFVHLLIIAGFYDLATSQVQSRQHLALPVSYAGGETLLSAIARKPSAFPTGRRLRVYQKAVYVYQRGIAVTGIQKMMTNISSRIPRMMTRIASFIQKYMLLTLINFIIAVYNRINGEKKWMHQQKKFLARLLCEAIISQTDHGTASSILKQPLLLAAASGAHEVVEEILKSFPDVVSHADEENHNAFHLAVINRHEGVFNLIFEMNGHRHLLLMPQDSSGNNILHLAGRLAPPYQLNRIPGAALQMQRELQWFKEVEKVVPPTFREDKNTEGKTPALVFAEKHLGLVKEGEEWMKGAASSCSIATALIATVVFAAAITVPGGNNSVGQPNFYKEKAFTVFGIADSISLFSSIAAIFMFLSILTARYAEGDFLYALPKRLILGLFMLFLSVTAMMVAFGATVYLVFSEEKQKWVLGLVIGSAILPVSVFAYSQFPLLLELTISTYGPSIFGKQSTGVFYKKVEFLDRPLPLDTVEP